MMNEHPALISREIDDSGCFIRVTETWDLKHPESPAFCFDLWPLKRRDDVREYTRIFEIPKVFVGERGLDLKPYRRQ